MLHLYSFSNSFRQSTKVLLYKCVIYWAALGKFFTAGKGQASRISGCQVAHSFLLCTTHMRIEGWNEEKIPSKQAICNFHLNYIDIFIYTYISSKHYFFIDDFSKISISIPSIIINGTHYLLNCLLSCLLNCLPNCLGRS